MKRRLALAKIPLCLLIGCSAIFGYVLADPIFNIKSLLTGIGIFVLATGAATLNSMQEYRLDGLLARTRNRPLPRGLVSIRHAAIQAVILILAGLLMLLAATKALLPVTIAAFAILLYNGIYTPLKEKTVLAIIPGALCGALPPYIGWLSGGGGVDSYGAALLLALFILWQVPHFWLVLLTYQEDYARSSLPNLLQQFQEERLKRFFVTWIGGLVFVMLMFVTLPLPISWLFRVSILVNACLLLLIFVYELAIKKANNYRRLFIVLNTSLLLHMLLVASGRISA